MALVIADLVQETTSTTGTGTLTLTGAVTGFQTFAAIGNANTTYYRIKSGTDSEVGIGTYTLSGTTLSRDTVLYSSAGGTTKINVAAGATVISTYPAERAVALDAVGNLGVGVQTATSKVAVTDNTLAASGVLSGTLLDLAQTWGTTANPTAIKLNVTGSAGSTAKLMDLQVGGVSKFSVAKDGTIVGTGVNINGNVMGGDGQNRLDIGATYSSRIGISSSGTIGWTSNSSSSHISLNDLYIARDAAGIFAQRNGTNAQTFRLYNTYTDASNYSRLTFTTNANNHQITSEAAGTGAVKPIISSFYTSASDPTTTDVPTGFSSIWKNSGTGLVKLWVNDGGTFKSITLV